MTATNGTHPVPRNRNISGLSDEVRRDGLLRTAWVNIVAGFKCRPSPRGPWDETATGDQTPWKYVIAPIRSAIRDAVNSGNVELINQTLEGARAFCRELEADFVSLVPQESEESLLALAISETELQGAADPVQMALVANPNCPTAAERAVLPLERHHSRIAKLLERCRIHARSARSSALVLR